MATMSESRYFPNTFNDFSQSSASEIIDLETKEVTQELKKSLQKSIMKLLKHIEDKLPDELDWKDTSVYTGTSGYTLLYLHLTEFYTDDKYFQVTQELKKSLQKSIMKLLKHIEDKLPDELDWKDTSVYTGTSGYTLLYLHLTEFYTDDKYFQKAYTLAEKSIKCLKGRRLSFLCGDSGPLALAAIIYDKLQLSSDVQFCISNLVKLKKDVLDVKSDLPDELLYGRIGYLYALLLVKQKVKSELIDTDLIRSVILAILDSGRALSKRQKLKAPLGYEWHDKNYFGAAHGLCGIFTLLLQVHERLTTTELKDLVRPSIDDLATFLFPSGNLPSSFGSTSDRLVHWCHGAPGAIFMFSYAYKVFRDLKYLELAKGCADVIWSRGLLKKGYGLCHGTAGNGYALLFLYQMTNDIKYLYMATQFGRWCQDYGKHDCRTPDRPLSLFEGLAGTLHFFTALLEPSVAKFPAFIL